MTPKALTKAYVEHKEGFWILQWPNPQYLYNYVKSQPIKKVLDLGTGLGLSAAVISLALKDKGEKNYSIHTVDQFEKCYKLAQEVMPAELKEGVYFHHIPTAVWETEYIPYAHLSIFEKLPEGDFDLIVVDGPGPWEENGKYIDLPNGDVTKMLLEGKLKKGAFIVWDGRETALYLLERYFGGNFYFTFQGPNSDLRVIEYKGGELKVGDTRYESIKNSTYFNGNSVDTSTGQQQNNPPQKP